MPQSPSGTALASVFFLMPLVLLGAAPLRAEGRAEPSEPEPREQTPREKSPEASPDGPSSPPAAPSPKSRAAHTEPHDIETAEGKTQRPSPPGEASTHSSAARKPHGEPDAPPDAAPNARPWPMKIGPFVLATQDGKNSLGLGFAGQLELRMTDTDMGPGEGRESELKPLLRRVRITLGGTFASKTLGYYLQLSTAPGSMELMDFWLEWTFSRFATLRVGHQKIPFTRYRNGSFKDLTFVDWSILSPTFGDERQIGLVFHNYNGDPHWLLWGLGVLTGINQRAAHALGISRTFKEKVENPSNLVDPGPVDAFHPELVARVGYRLGKVTLDTDTDWEGGPLRLFAGVGATWDLDADPVRDFGARLAGELLVKVRHTSLALNAYLGWARELEGGRLDQRWAMWGILAQWSVLVAQRYEISARYALVDRGKRFLASARQRSETLIAGATDPEEADVLTRQYALAGKVRREQEATLGFNVYLVGRSLKGQLDLSWLGTERLDASRDDIRLRLQLQLAF